MSEHTPRHIPRLDEIKTYELKQFGEDEQQGWEEARYLLADVLHQQEDFQRLHELGTKGRAVMDGRVFALAMALKRLERTPRKTPPPGPSTMALLTPYPFETE